MQDTLPVLIVGAGPAGLASALILTQNGIQVRIIDKADAFHTGSRGFGIQPRSYELFQVLGVLEDIQNVSVPIPTMRAYKLPGGTVAVKTWDLYEKGQIWPDRPYANGACVSQDLLEGVFRKHLEKYGVTVELGKGLIAIQQDGDRVSATIAVHKDGKLTDETEVVHAKYLLGSDGAKGATRKLLGLEFQGETRDADGMVWGDVEIPNLPNDYWHIWGKPGHFTIMARPLSPTSHRFGIGITGQNFDPTNLAEPEKAIAFIHEETGRTELEFGKFTWLSHFRPNMRMVNKFQEGRAFVVGDSAHVHSPTGGQGLNCSLQDASNLSWKLSVVLKGLASPDILTTYGEERLPVIAQMLHATTQLYTHTVKKEKPIDKPAEAEDEKASGWFRWRNSALELYGVNYRFSTIVVEERDTQTLDSEDVIARAYSGYEGLGSLRAGDRAPEAPGLATDDGQTTSLFNLLRASRHTVLLFNVRDADVASITSALSKLPTDSVQSYIVGKEQVPQSVDSIAAIVDKEGHAHNGYLIRDDNFAAVIIRPDTFIGAIAVSTTGISTYFEKIFT